MFRPLSFLLVLALASALNAAEISRRNIRFVEYPDFPEAHSTWRSIGYSSRYNRVFVAVTNHRDRVCLYEWDIAAQSMRCLGSLDSLARLRPWQWQAKVHSQLLEGADGCMYFATDGGESREEFLMEHPDGYGGGMFLKWDPARSRLTTLGSLGDGLRFESIKDIALDPAGGLIYAVSYPQAHFLVFDPASNNLRDLGRLGSEHVPRCVFQDWWGNAYYVDWRQRLVKYERQTGRLLFDQDSLPAFPGTPAADMITGVPTYASDRSRGLIYLITYGNMVLSFQPQRRGIGPVRALGPTLDRPKLPPPGYSPNLAMADNGRLYYFVGGHGRYAVRDTTLLVEFDPVTRNKRVVLRFPVSEISEVTGCDVKDSQGNLYFAGRRYSREAENVGESGASRPFMIIFNPQREVVR